MSLSRWKLSTAIALLLCKPSLAEGLDRAYFHAMYCTMIAATVYAELTTESADSIAEAAPQKCYDEWRAAAISINETSVGELERSIGRSLTSDEKRSVPFNPALTVDVKNEVRLRVIDWRSQAAIGHSSIFSEQRAGFQRKDDALTLSKE